MLKNLKLVPASIEDAERIKDLINLCYRGMDGWTKETKIVSGDRISIDDTKTLIQKHNSKMFTVSIDETMIACIGIEQKENKAYISAFAVLPSYQNMGIGKQVLSQAEEYAANQFKAKELILVVVSQRQELIEYYERRGYKRTGQISKYPVHLNVGIPIIEGLTIEYLSKNT